MRDVKHILVALDFSDYSKPTLEYAAYLARCTQARLSTANVVNQRDIDALNRLQVYPGVETSAQDYVARVIAGRNELLDQYCAQLGCAELIGQRIFRTGVPAQEVLGAIQDSGADLVVIGHKGRTNLADQFFGSCAQRVLRRARVPVLVVRDGD